MDYYDSVGLSLPNLSKLRRGLPRGGQDMRGKLQMGRGMNLPSQLTIPGSSTPMAAFNSGNQNNRVPLGFPSITWTNASTDTLETVTTRPQQSLRPERLVIGVTRSAGAAAIAVTVDSVKVGKNEMLPNSNPIPVEMFSADAVGSAMLLNAATFGYDISLSVSVSAIPGSGETVVVVAGFYCEAVQE